MKLIMFSVYDKAVKAFLQPFYCRTAGEAIRSFTDAVNDPGKGFGKYAMDYDLVRIGEFDDNDGSVVGSSVIKVIGAIEVLEAKELPPVPPGSA